MRAKVTTAIHEAIFSLCRDYSMGVGVVSRMWPLVIWTGLESESWSGVDVKLSLLLEDAVLYARKGIMMA